MENKVEQNRTSDTMCFSMSSGLFDWRKFINKLVDSPTLQKEIYELIIKSGMLEDYQVPDNYFTGDELPQIQPPQIKWAWNCLNYRVKTVNRPFIFMKKHTNE